MFDTSMAYKFNGVAHDDKAPDGPNRGARYATDWTAGEERFRVSSVENSHTTETMIFKIMENGEPSYFDLWADRVLHERESAREVFSGISRQSHPLGLTSCHFRGTIDAWKKHKQTQFASSLSMTG